MCVQSKLIKGVMSMCSFLKRYNLPVSCTRIFLLQLALTMLVCITHAGFADANTCDDPDYPDQYPSLSRECDNVVPMVVDKENSIKVLENNDHGTVIITGGSGTYTWSISGPGFFLDANLSQTTLEKTTAQTVTIYTNGEACGTGHIIVNDGCSTTMHGIRSGNGRWVQQPVGTKNPIPGAIGDWDATWKKSTAIEGNWKVIEHQSYRIRDDYGVLSTVDGYHYIEYFDPTHYYNLSCTSGIQITQDPQYADRRALAETFYKPTFPKSPSYPTLYPVALEKMDGYYIPGGVSLMHIGNSESGWIGTHINGSPIAHFECVYNSGSPTGTSYILSSYAQGFWWFDIVGSIEAIYKWECQ